MTLTAKEKEDIYLSLMVRIGIIETGTIHRAKDLERIGEKDKIQALTTAQMRKILELEELADKILNS